MPKTRYGPGYGPLFVTFTNMAKHKNTTPHDPVKDAQREAEKDIHLDPEFAEGDPTDDLDEGELARRDNSDEEGLNALDKKRPRGGNAGTGHAGTGPAAKGGNAPHPAKGGGAPHSGKGNNAPHSGKGSEK
jgi:hypothetical protein